MTRNLHLCVKGESTLGGGGGHFRQENVFFWVYFGIICGQFFKKFIKHFDRHIKWILIKRHLA